MKGIRTLSLWLKTFRRHDNCGCSVTYEDGEMRQDAWSKRTWQASPEELAERKELEDKLKPVRFSPEEAAAKEKEVLEQRAHNVLTRSENSDIIDDERRISTRSVDTGGRRNEKPLSTKQVEQMKDYANNLGMPRDRIRYGDHYNTSYGSNFDMLYIGTDVLPSNNPQTANARLSWKSAIAHEVVGHRESCIKGWAQKAELLDEVQASIRAARFAPGLSKVERINLLRDAGERAQESNLRLKDIKSTLHIDER